jgi:hypothetical protein
MGLFDFADRIIYSHPPPRLARAPMRAVLLSWRGPTAFAEALTINICLRAPCLCGVPLGEEGPPKPPRVPAAMLSLGGYIGSGDTGPVPPVPPFTAPAKLQRRPAFVDLLALPVGHVVQVLVLIGHALAPLQYLLSKLARVRGGPWGRGRNRLVRGAAKAGLGAWLPGFTAGAAAAL